MLPFIQWAYYTINLVMMIWYIINKNLHNQILHIYSTNNHPLDSIRPCPKTSNNKNYVVGVLGNLVLKLFHVSSTYNGSCVTPPVRAGSREMRILFGSIVPHFGVRGVQIYLLGRRRLCACVVYLHVIFHADRTSIFSDAFGVITHINTRVIGGRSREHSGGDEEEEHSP